MNEKEKKQFAEDFEFDCNPLGERVLQFKVQCEIAFQLTEIVAALKEANEPSNVEIYRPSDKPE